MNIEQRVGLLKKLGEFLLSPNEEWEIAKERASYENPWFLPEFVQYQLHHIATEYLAAGKLEKWLGNYEIPVENHAPKNVGIVMAGNIPLAGFHDFLSAFVSGHRQIIKPSSKDFELIANIVKVLAQWEPAAGEIITIADQLKGCDAYIATGSNNSSRYFEYYFSKYPHIIRRNRTSVAILTGNETLADLEALADDVYLYFGLGCRNVTKLYVPRDYDFLPLLEAFKKYNWLADNSKYKNNYDYQLAIMIINKAYYMTNGSLLLQENKALFSPISQLHYEYYMSIDDVYIQLNNSRDVQCIVGTGEVPFGRAQRPALNDYADKADTLQFLLEF
jgi:hypothetical protein